MNIGRIKLIRFVIKKLINSVTLPLLAESLKMDIASYGGPEDFVKQLTETLQDLLAP